MPMMLRAVYRRPAAYDRKQRRRASLVATRVVTSLTVTPPTLALVTATFVPQLRLVVTPNLVGDGDPDFSPKLLFFAPKVKIAFVVPKLALVLTEFAPQLRLSITPPQLVLTLSTSVPQLRLIITPPTSALLLTEFAPQLQPISPPKLSLTLATFAPQIRLVVIPGVQTLSLAALIPQLRTVVTVPATTRTTTLFVPQLRLVITPSTLAPILATFVPQLRLVVTPNLVGDGDPDFSPKLLFFAPKVKIAFVVPKLALVLTKFAPQLRLSIITGAPADGGTLQTTRFAPNITVTSSGTVIPATRALVLTRFAPTVIIHVIGGVFSEDFVVLEHVLANDGTITAYDVVGPLPTVFNPDTRTMQTCRRRFSLLTIPPGSSDVQGEQDLVSRTIAGSTHYLKLAHRGNYVTAWRTVTGVHNVDWLCRQSDYGASFNPNERWFEDLDESHSPATIRVGHNPTFAGSSGDPVGEPLISETPSVPIYLNTRHDTEANLVVETAVVPLHFDPDGLAEGAFYDHGGGPNNPVLFWRMRMFARIEPNWRGHANIHRNTYWGYQPRAWGQDFVPEEARPYFGQIFLTMATQKHLFNQAYALDLVSGVLTAIPNFNSPQPIEPSRSWIIQKDSSSISYPTPLEGLPSPAPSGYVAVLFVTPGNFCVAVACKLFLTSENLDMTKLTTVSVFAIQATFGEDGRTGFGRVAGIDVGSISRTSRKQGWVGFSTFVFTGDSADAIPALRGLYSSGVLDLPPPVDLPGLVTIGTTWVGPDTPTITEEEELMLQKTRIHNALLELTRNGSFFSVSVDPNTSEMSIDESTKIVPLKVTIVETLSSWSRAKHFKRNEADERSNWRWIVKLSFNQRVAVERFEEGITVKTPTILPDLASGLSGILVRLVSSEYTEPPEQSPNRGSIVDLTFEATLRR